MNELKKKFIGFALTNALAHGISKNKNLTQKVLDSRGYRLESEIVRQPSGCLTNVAKFGLEFVPIPIPGYGVYDVISVGEGVFGQELAGRRLDWIDRGVFIISGVVPVWPAVPTRALILAIRQNTEDKVYEINEKKTLKTG